MAKNLREHQQMLDFTGEQPARQPTLAEKFEDLPLPQKRVAIEVERNRDTVRWAVQRVANGTNASSAEQRQKAWEYLPLIDTMNDQEIVAMLLDLGIRADTGNPSMRERIGLLQIHEAVKKDAEQSDAA